MNNLVSEIKHLFHERRRISIGRLNAYVYAYTIYYYIETRARRDRRYNFRSIF